MNKNILILAPALLIQATVGHAQQYDFQRKEDRVMEQNDNADQSGIERFGLHFQTTYIYQYKPSFNAKYSGANSLSADEEHQNSLTATLFAGVRLWKGAELYVNPELAGGSGLTGALGMAGSSNGETFRVGNPSPTLYLARAYYKQTFSLRNKHARKIGVVNSEAVESGQDQLAGYDPKEYLRFYAGKLCLGDLFDNNEYSNTPRMQFMNWSLMNNGAWDYAANTRGYTLSFVTELQLGKMNYKVGAAALPKVANGPDLNTDFSEAISLNAEISRSIKIHKRNGNIRLLGYYNRTTLGSYAVATYMPKPDIDATQAAGRTKLGFGLNMDQELSNTFGLFARIGWNDGKNETWCFTEIDQTASLGLSANGAKWKRPNDNCGVAIVVNGISKDHRDYLASGGSGFMLGDGKLNYAPEAVGEIYYNFKPIKSGIWLSGDYQYCMNPGYNADRGPVSIFSVRVHVEL